MDAVGADRPPPGLPTATSPVAPENTSGQGAGSPVPPEVRGWNWGAFVFGWLWGIFNRVWISLLTLIPLVSLVMVFVLGAKGNEWAWQKKSWDSVEHFKRTQRRWARAAAVVTALSLLGAVLVLAFADAPVEGNQDLTKVVESDEGDFWMITPETWTKDHSLHESADLAASDVYAEQYLIVLAEPKRRRRLAAFADLTRSFLVESLPSSSETEPRRVTVGEHTGLQAEVRGYVDGEHVVYLHTAVIGDEHAFQVIAWTLESHWFSNADTLRAVTAAVHES